MSVLQATALHKSYVAGDGSRLVVLDDVNLTVQKGEMVAVIGESGSGKSTLLHLLGALDHPTSGEVVIAGVRVTPLPGAPDAGIEHGAAGRGGQSSRRFVAEASRRDRELSALRNRSIGFVFQFHHLLREFDALENVAMPLLVAGVPVATARRRAAELLSRVGLGSRMDHRPGQLSGGEQQRTAVARALATEPAVLLADEPSGNLDQGTSERLHDLLAEISREVGIAMVLVTHNQSLAMRAQRVLRMEGGKLRDAVAGEG